MAPAGIAYRSVPERSAQRLSPRAVRATRMNSLLLRVLICLVMIALFVYIGRMAAITAGAKQIAELRQQIDQMKDNREYLEITLTTRQNLNRVRDEATTRLGMVYPEEVYMVSLSGYSLSVNTQTAYDAQPMP